MTVVINGTTGISADFSNATVANRQSFQTSTTNSSTGIYALPNGTSTAASWQATNNSDPTNASKVLIATNGSTDVQLVSGRNGTGTYLPLTFYTNGSEQMRVDTSGNVGIGVTSTNGYKVAVGGSGLKNLFINTDANNAYLYTDGNAYFGSTAAFNTVFITNNTEQARIDSAGLFKFNSGYGSVATAYGCRAWVNFDGTASGTISPRASGNVTSITKNATGDYTVNITTAMPDANYATLITSSSGFPTNFMANIAANASQSAVVAPTTSAMRFATRNGGNTATDFAYLNVAIFR
jgi:hypothetical protein